MFYIVFYVFSLFLSYLDLKKYIVPNIMLITMFIMLVVFGLLEDRIFINSIYLAFLMFVFFIVIFLLNRDLLLGGGDIKYMLLVTLLFEPIAFFLFVLITGIIQIIFLIYFQNIRKKPMTPMIPSMFMSVVLVQLFY
ncbi:prepilin peptidase [Arcobacter sp. YIC-310]|uniref:prepilin peptidase n=1 Tax=Arcobacter sp. YIC-310 TaxID=3376632 RepID=UPI003C1FC5B8